MAAGGAGSLGWTGAAPVPAELMLLLLADSRLPTGAHTQSAGIEPALRSGLPLAQVPNYLRSRLRTITATEAGTAVVARFRCLSGDLTALSKVDEAWRGRTISPAARENSGFLGRGLLRVGRRLWPTSITLQAVSELDRPCRGVVTGAVAATAGLDALTTARMIGYEDAQAVAAATLKLAPCDPVDAAGWVLAVVGDIELMARGVAALTEPEHIPARAAPLIERWAELHAVATQRLFRA